MVALDRRAVLPHLASGSAVRTKGRCRRTAAVVAAISIVLCLAWRIYLSGHAPVARTYNGFDTGIDGIMFGCLMALIQSDNLRNIARRFCPAPVIFLGAVAVSASWQSWWFNSFGITRSRSLVRGLLCFRRMNEISDLIR
jgi:hypothetical protein